MELYLILYLIIILFIYYIYNLYDKAHFLIENFEDKYGQNEVYKDIYDKEFVDFYDIIYKKDDYEDEIPIYIEKELKNKENPTILVVGCGRGSILQRIKKKYKNTHGIDKSEQMLKKCHENHPYIKTIKGDIEKPKLFEDNTYDLILFDEFTLNYNNKESINNIINNIKPYLRNDGVLFVPMIEYKYLQPRPRYYSTTYYDSKKNIHGYTYVNNVAHDCYYIKNEKEIDGFNYNYFDKIILKNNNSRIKKIPLYIPEKEDLYEIFLKKGYNIKKIYDYDDFSKIFYEVCIFKKSPTSLDVSHNDNILNK
jgi:SAM-dependent methyltransferase